MSQSYAATALRSAVILCIQPSPYCSQCSHTPLQLSPYCSQFSHTPLQLSPYCLQCSHTSLQLSPYCSQYSHTPLQLSTRSDESAVFMSLCENIALDVSAVHLTTLSHVTASLKRLLFGIVAFRVNTHFIISLTTQSTIPGIKLALHEILFRSLQRRSRVLERFFVFPV